MRKFLHRMFSCLLKLALGSDCICQKSSKDELRVRFTTSKGAPRAARVYFMCLTSYEAVIFWRNKLDNLTFKITYTSKLNATTR